jgi:hypothetical protein
MKHLTIVSQSFLAIFLVVLIGCGNPLIGNNKNNSGSSSFGSPANFPEFYFLTYVIDPVSNPTIPEILYHNPTSEYDFPSILDTDNIPALMNNSHGRFFLYYSPHNGVGGINVAFANNIEGPWIDYEHNPVISRDVLPTTQIHNGREYRYLGTSSSTEHVSTASPIWNEAENKLFMYYHGYGNHATQFFDL